MTEPVPTSNPDQLEHAATIRKRLYQSNVIIQRFELASGDYAPVGSAIASDDAASAPFHTSHTVVTALTMATENLRALNHLLLVSDQIVAPMYAHYPVMRSVLEAAALAKWILEPDERRERVLRSLRARAEDIRHDKALRENEIATVLAMDLLGEDPEIRAAQITQQETTNAKQHAEDLHKLRALCDRHGFGWSAVKDGLPPWIHLIKEVTTIPAGAEWHRIPGSYAAGLWKVMSGLSHPSVSRSVNHSTLERLDTHGVPSEDGTFIARMSASLDWTNQALTVAANTTSEAVTLFTQRQQAEVLYRS